MRIRFVIIQIVLCIINNSCAQNEINIGNKDCAQNEINIGKKDTIFSKTLNEKREIWVSVPSDYRKNLSNQEFSVVYILDGPDHFFSVVGMIDRFSNNIANETCPPMIVVGLVSTNRTMDFYPNFENDKFGVFLKDELIPYIDRKYPTKPFRVLIGHSIAGLRTINTLIYNKGLFNAYIAIDPSLGDRYNKWYNVARKDIRNFELGDTKLFVAMGQTMKYNEVHDTADIKKDTTSDSNHMRRIMEFSEKMMSKNNDKKVNFQWKYYLNETHQSLTQIAIFDGFNFVFNWYKPTFWSKFFYDETSPQEAIALYDNYYKSISKQLGYEVKPPFDDSILISYLEFKKQYEKALEIAKYNLKIHPDNKAANDWIDKITKEIGKK